jgi:DNA-binding transcriptional LysR family regulator
VGVARVVAAGAGIGLVSESLVQGELGAGTLVPVPDLDVCGSIELSVVTMADSSSTIVDEVVAAALANSPFRRTPFEA